eukprot:TRINITY_DN92794_c0_g1_i1.p1 TRINITY_DN92794_c0_g1~~TRINITY_DN92794_c0_g1_i1.p1  ORF type:complete len:669 (+),score=115.46 TRINITY_DN92794_c0_g1_i1:84-2090(+)
MPHNTIAKSMPIVRASKVWTSESRSSPGKEKKRHSAEDSIEPLFDLKFQIDQCLSRCRTDIDYCLKDFARRATKTMLQTRSRTSPAPPQPSTPSSPIPEMLLPSEVTAVVTEIEDSIDIPSISGDMASPLSSSIDAGSTWRPSTAPAPHYSPESSEKKTRRVPDDHVRVGPRAASAGRSRRDRAHGGKIQQSTSTGPSSGDEVEKPAVIIRSGCTKHLDRLTTSRPAAEQLEDFSEPEVNLGRQVFTSVEDLKQQMKANIIGDGDGWSPGDLLHETGLARTIALHPIFEYTTLVFIFVNAIWMAYDTDMNDATTLNDAKIEFVIMENVFCVFFSMELLVRFLAFKKKRWFYRDSWFIFDSCLVFSMVLETWVVSLIVAVTGADLEGSNVFVVFRLARLTRLARMARLLRALPELLIMVKAIMVSMRTVVYALILLFVMVYVFAIAFTQLMEGKTKEPGTASYDNFRTVPMAINTLLLSGALPDQASLVDTMSAESPVYYFMMLAFLFFASLTVMNMLIGILCDVISDVSDVEKESMLIANVKAELMSLLRKAELVNDDLSLTRPNYELLLLHPKAAPVFGNLGVDIFGLVDFADVIFENVETVCFSDLMDTILELRGSNNATVKDIMELRKLVTKETAEQSRRLERMINNQNKMMTTLRAAATSHFTS